MDAVLARRRSRTNVAKEGPVPLLEMDTFRRFARDSLSDYDYPAQNIPHRAFWHTLGVTNVWGWDCVQSERFYERGPVSTASTTQTQDQGVTDWQMGKKGLRLR